MTRLGVVDLSKKVIDNVARVQRRAALHILPEGRKVITKFRKSNKFIEELHEGVFTQSPCSTSAFPFHPPQLC